MVPEDILKPFIKHFQVPDSLVRLLYLLLQREIETNYASLDYSPNHDKSEDRQPAVRFAKGLLRIWNKLPPIYDLEDGKLYATIRDLAALNDEDMRFLASLRTPVEWLKWNSAIVDYEDDIHWLEMNIEHWKSDTSDAASSSRQQLRQDEARLRKVKEKFKTLKDNEPEYNPVYLTRFWQDLLNFNVSFELSHRNRHCHIIGLPGTGKSSLIKKLCFMDMQSDASVIVMAPKGNLVETLARVPTNKEVIWVKDWSQVGLNIADIDRELIVYVFEALLESAPTSMQKAFLVTYVPQIRSLEELRTLKVPENYKKTRDDSITWRLDLIPPIVDDILSRETNIDLLDIIDSGKCLLLDAKHLHGGAKFIGRFFIALIAKAIQRRNSNRLCSIYVDEAQLFLTEGYTEEIIEMAREANVGLTLAHHRLSQFAPGTRDSVHLTATKFVGKVIHEDSVAMGNQTGVDPGMLKNLPDFTFMLSGMKKPFPIRVAWDEVDRLATVHREHFVSPRPHLKVAEEPAQYTDVGTKPFKWPRD